MAANAHFRKLLMEVYIVNFIKLFLFQEYLDLQPFDLALSSSDSQYSSMSHSSAGSESDISSTIV